MVAVGPVRGIGDIETRDVVDVLNPDGRGNVVLICEHASNVVPRTFDNLGLDGEGLNSHIAWDPGAHGVAAGLSARLDAPLLAPKFSRLVYDVNRPPQAYGAMPARSEDRDIPGNAAIDPGKRLERTVEFYGPFRNAVAEMLDRRIALGRSTAVVTVHSFTPVYLGHRRDLDVGVLHDRDGRLADALLDELAEEGLDCRRNQPYGPEDGVTHTLALHAVPRGLMNVMIEIRNDLVLGSDRQSAFAGLLARRLSGALDRVQLSETERAEDGDSSRDEMGVVRSNAT